MHLLLAESGPEIAAAVDRVVSSLETRMRLAQSARALVCGVYDWSVIGKQLCALHEGLAESRSRQRCLRGFLKMRPLRVMAMLEANNLSGTAKAVLEFAKEASRGHPGSPEIDLSILTFDRGHGETCLTKAIRDIGTPLDVVHERRRFDTSVIPQLRSLVEKRGVDLIWSNSVKSHFLVRWAGLNRSRKWVAFHHGYTTTDTKMRIYNQLDRWSLRTANRVFTSSAAFIEELERSNVQRDHIHVQHMPVRPFAPVSEKQKMELRQELRLNEGTRVLLSVGRLSREKGHADLIQALPKIRELTGNSPLRLVLVGEGPERPRIEELCRNLRVSRFRDANRPARPRQPLLRHCRSIPVAFA